MNAKIIVKIKTKLREHIPSGFSTSTISSLKTIENKLDVNRDIDCVKKFCESLRQHAMKIINFKKIKMKPLTKKQYNNAKTVLYL